MIVQTAVLIVLLGCVHTFTIPSRVNGTKEKSDNISYDEFSVSALIEKANANLGKTPGDHQVLFGDIAVPTDLQNADLCTKYGCLWTKAADGKVYVPYKLSLLYEHWEQAAITQAMQSFASSTCIRFIPAHYTHRYYIDIQPQIGCYSFVGRQNFPQVLSLQRNACVVNSVIQHELLHALGFNHEQCRSDRDQHVRILYENITPGYAYAFNKLQTDNLQTPYDYNSVMHYDRYAFSWNKKPTILPIPDNNVPIGTGTEMNVNDILRINRLYNCN